MLGHCFAALGRSDQRNVPGEQHGKIRRHRCRVSGQRDVHQAAAGADIRQCRRDRGDPGGELTVGERTRGVFGIEKGQLVGISGHRLKPQP